MTIKALQAAAQIRNAKTMARNMGVTLTRPIKDNITGKYRDEIAFSWGFDAKSPKLAPSGLVYEMKPSYPKILMTSIPTMGIGVAGMYLAYTGLMNGEKPDILKIVGGLGMIGASAAVMTPKTMSL